MPTIQQQNNIVITPEKFLEACSQNELREIEILIFSPRFQQTIQAEGILQTINKQIAQNTIGRKPQIYYCSICEHTPVDGDNGVINCQQCLDKMEV
ncbi:hypothetical protein [Mucilaginibacter sp.]|uniref:hypothetical protein n=1 Tax=Mucilaginibacter sp. TaxID=1882438 RepID=UPI00261B4661|nr:hypothetical protein [Mucilaginibacter sp.]MDB4920777.1 hypothetical protein [Mucilaginibacter sp.]